jgi:Zn-dependent hydrolases, including glyoxylases
MKQIALTALVLLGTALPLFAQPSRESLPEWRFGFASAYAVQDRASEMAAAVFPDAKAIFDQLLPDGKAPSSISTFLVRVPVLGEKAVYILVDTGLGGESSNLLDNLKKMGFSDGITPEDISFVLLTHLHGDHIGGLFDGDKRQFPNAKVLCGKVEYDYWIGQNNAQVNKIKSAYGDDFRGEFAFDELLSLGNDPRMLTIKTLDARGHTPGHTAFLLESAGQKLMIVGDIIHAAAVQFAHPEVCARYDMDAKQAIETRKRLLDMAAEENIPIAGMHLPGTGFALIQKAANGGYQHTLTEQNVKSKTPNEE